MSHSVTYAQIAEACGVSVMTVSRAFTHRGRISTATRDRILEKADELGYQRDPMLAALVRYRQEAVSLKKGVVIAYVTDFDVPIAESRVPSYRDFWEGAKQEAEKLGYQLQEFQLSTFSSVQEFRDVLKARGIRLLLISPLWNRDAFNDFDFEGFAVVSLGLSLQGAERLDRVSHDHFAAVMLCGREILKSGYRRTGMVVQEDVDQRVEGRWKAAYAQLSHMVEGVETVPPFMRIPIPDWEDWNRELLNWMRTYSPECIVTTATTTVRRVLQQQEKLPSGSVGIVGLDIPEVPGETPDTREFAGVEQNSKESGMYAVRILDRRFMNREFGLRDCPITVQIKGRFLKGLSLRSHSGPLASH